MAEVGSVITRLVLETQQFSQNLQRATQELSRGTQRMAQDAQRMGLGMSQGFGRVEASATRLQPAIVSLRSAVAGLGLALTAGAVVTGLQRLVTSAAQAGDELQKLSIRTGVTVESLSALKLAAELNDTSLQELGSALRLMQVNVAAASRGSGEAAGVLRAMGVSIDEMRRSASDPEGFLELFARRLAAIRDPGQRVEAAFRVLGRQAQGLMPLLQDLAQRGMQGVREEAERLGVVISTDAAQAAAAFNDHMSRVRRTLDGLAQRIGNYYIPRLNAFLDLLGLAQKGGVEQRAERFQALLAERRSLEERLQRQSGGFSLFQGQRGGEPERLRQRIAAINEELATTRREMIDLAKTELRRDVGPPLTLDLGDTKATLDQAAKSLERFREGLRVNDAMVQVFGTSADTLRERVQLLQGRLTDLLAQGFAPTDPAIQALVRRLQEAEQALSAFERATRLQADIQTPLERYTAGLMNAADLLQRNAINASEYAREVARLAEQLGLPPEVEAHYRQLQQVLDDLITPQQRFAEQQRLLQELLDRGRISIEEYNQALRRYAEQLPDVITEQDRLKASSGETGELARQLGLSFSSAFEDAGVAGRSLSDLLDGLERDLRRILWRKFVTEPLIEGLDKGLKGLQEGGLAGLVGRGPKAAADASEASTALQPLATASTQATAALQPLPAAVQPLSPAMTNATTALSPFTAAIQQATAALQAMASTSPGGGGFGNLIALASQGPNVTYDTTGLAALADLTIGGGFETAKGGVFSAPQRRLIAEAGPEAVVPLQGGAIPAMVDALGQLKAVLPMGLGIPIDLPAMQAGGIIAPGTRVSPEVASRVEWSPERQAYVDPARSLYWPSQVPGALGYVAPQRPKRDEVPWWQRLLSLLLGSGIGFLAGQLFGGAGFSSKAGQAHFVQSSIQLASLMSGSFGGPMPMAAQHGALLRGPRLVLAGESGPEAFIPLTRAGGIPAMMDAMGRMAAVLPQGLTIPIEPMARGGLVTSMQLGGLVGQPLPMPHLSTAAGTPRHVEAALAGIAREDDRPGSRKREVSIVNNFDIKTPDANSFRASQSQIISAAFLTMKRNERRNL